MDMIQSACKVSWIRRRVEDRQGPPAPSGALRAHRYWAEKKSSKKIKIKNPPVLISPVVPEGACWDLCELCSRQDLAL